MPSFQIADCPTALVTVEKGEGEVRTREGKLSLTVRNAAAVTQTARISIESDAGADPSWFVIENAPSTSPQMLERDFDANATQTIAVAVKVPADAKDGTYSFRVRVTSEADPDNDFAEGPAVSLTIPPLKEPPQPKKFPWWIAIVAGVAVVVIVAVVVLVFRGGPPELVDVIGETPEDARALLIDAGFREENITEETGSATGEVPGTVAETRLANGGRAVTLVIDPGVVVRAPTGSTLETAIVNLTADGLIPDVARIAAEDVTFFRVQTATPSDGETVALGTTISITTFVPRPEPGGGVVFPGDLVLEGCPPICLEIQDMRTLPDRFETPELPAGGRVLNLDQLVQPINPGGLVVNP